MTRPIQASLDLQALKQNLSIVRQAATHARVWSVVKANAYGHGIERIWSAIGATDGFALLNLEEAITLRERGWKGPILMLEGFFHAQDLEIYDQHRLTTCVHSNWQLKALQNARLKAPLDIYLKVNSGMNRLGFQPDRVLTVWQQLRAMANVGEMTLMSHFAEAEHPDGISSAMARIEQAAEGLDYDDLAPRENAFLEALSEEALPEDALQEMPEDFPQAVEALRARLSGGAEAGAQRGSAYHRAFELLSFQEGQSAEEAVEAMVAGGRLSQEEAELLDIRVLDRFLQSPLGRRMAKAKAEGRLFREQRFMVGIPARELAEEAGVGQQEKPSSESLQLLQGIIDAYMKNEDGSLTLIDYKTDRFYGLAPEAAKESLRQRYGLQLRLYRRALRQLLEKPVAETLIYSTWLSDAVQL